MRIIVLGERIHNMKMTFFVMVVQRVVFVSMYMHFGFQVQS